MSERHTVTINGRLYDALTGLVVDESTLTTSKQTASEAKPISHHSADIHDTTQRSQTLNRSIIKKPVAKVQPVSNSKHYSTVTKSPAVTKFAPHPQTNPNLARKTRTISDIAPMKHPNVERTHQLQNQKKIVLQKATAPQHHTVRHTPAQVIKQQAIAEALAKAPTKKQQNSTVTKKPFLARHPRAFSIASASLAVVLLGGYLTYINVPNLSVRVAAAQAGINATYPEYKPDGYRLNSAVAVSEGTVKIQFASNSGSQNFAVTQTKSGWDSAAVVDNLVKPKSNDNYITTNERGLTIYTYDGDAAWVNGGILYTIEGDAPLSGEQIRRIATSL